MEAGGRQRQRNSRARSRLRGPTESNLQLLCSYLVTRVLTLVIRCHDIRSLSHRLLNIPHPGKMSVCQAAIALVSYSKTLASLKAYLNAFLLAGNICYGRLCSDKSLDIRFLLALVSAGILSCSRNTRLGRGSAEACSGCLRRLVFM